MTPKSYQVGLVGESTYQEAVELMDYGHRVILEHEPENQHDPLAVVARNEMGDVLGYIGRGTWLQRAVAVERKDVEAYVLEVTGGTNNKRLRGLLLNVAIGLEAEKMRTRRAGTKERRGCLGFLFR